MTLRLASNNIDGTNEKRPGGNRGVSIDTRESDNMTGSVQFGKYKGRPVEDLLADTGYMQWLEGQPWFREKYGHLIQMRDAEAANRTPVHNRIQAKFLNPAHCRAFVSLLSQDEMDDAKRTCLARGNKIEAEKREQLVRLTKELEVAKQAAQASNLDGSVPFLPSSIDDLERRIKTCQDFLRAIGEAKFDLEVRVEFEVDGADVLVDSKFITRGTAVGLDCIYRRVFLIEIKPTIGDDYPAVLRQMKRHRTNYLYVGTYCGEGVTRDQFVGVFNASGIVVVFEKDVEALLDS